jgi:hypothetical protein
MCAACAEYHERDKAERETASAIHAIHGMPGEPDPDTHAEHYAKAGVSTPCTAHHVNFGGGCLNCGWLPKGAK